MGEGLGIWMARVHAEKGDNELPPAQDNTARNLLALCQDPAVTETETESDRAAREEPCGPGRACGALGGAAREGAPRGCAGHAERRDALCAAVARGGARDGGRREG